MNCPFCGSNMSRSNKKVACTNKKCGFTIYRAFGTDFKLDDQCIDKIIADGNSDWIYFNANGKENFIRFFISGMKLMREFKYMYINGACPICGGAIMVTSKGFACANSIIGKSCNFHIPGFLSHRKITSNEAEDFLTGKTSVLDGFSNSNERAFSGILRFNEEKKIVYVDSVVASCPICGGKVHVGPTFYACENFKNKTLKCPFKIYRSICHHSVTVNELREICENGSTKDKIMFFKEDGNIFKTRLALSENGTTIFI